MKFTKNEIVRLLNAEEEALKALYKKADRIRKENMGDEVFLRGIIEISNYCKKNCNYCGIRSKAKIHRYRISKEEIVQECKRIEGYGMTTVVLQAGEDPELSPKLSPQLSSDSIGKLLIKIKEETGLAITLSLGVHDRDTLLHWKNCGMDRYLIRYETVNPVLFANAHPDDNLKVRLKCIKTLQELGVQTGTGFLIGLPEQTTEELAEEIVFCTSLEPDMIGIGPFIPSPGTPYGDKINPFNDEIFFKVIAIMRLLNPKAHIPATTAFDVIKPDGRDLLLQRGANIFMPNLTPQKYRKHYLLYPDKPHLNDSSEDSAYISVKRIEALGRPIGKGPGHSIKNSNFSFSHRPTQTNSAIDLSVTKIEQSYSFSSRD